MNDKRNIFAENRLIEAAVRRAVGVTFERPSLRSLRRSCSVYANVIAAVVALGLPTAGAVRQAANSAMSAFEASVRNFGYLPGPALLESPVDLSGVTETTDGAPDGAAVPALQETVSVSDATPAGTGYELSSDPGLSFPE